MFDDMFLEIGRLTVASARLEEWLTALEPEVCGVAGSAKRSASVIAKETRDCLRTQPASYLAKDTDRWLAEAETALERRNQVVHATWTTMPDEFKQRWELVGHHERSKTDVPQTPHEWEISQDGFSTCLSRRNTSLSPGQLHAPTVAVIGQAR